MLGFGFFLRFGSFWRLGLGFPYWSLFGLQGFYPLQPLRFRFVCRCRFHLVGPLALPFRLKRLAGLSGVFPRLFPEGRLLCLLALLGLGL